MARSASTSLDARPRGSRCSCGKLGPLTDEELEAQTEDLGLLANPIRLRLVRILIRGQEPICVCDLVTALGLKQPTVSHHLGLLKKAGVVDMEKRGIWSHWYVKRDELEQLKRRLKASVDSLA